MFKTQESGVYVKETGFLTERAYGVSLTRQLVNWYLYPAIVTDTKAF